MVGPGLWGMGQSLFQDMDNGAVGVFQGAVVVRVEMEAGIAMLFGQTAIEPEDPDGGCAVLFGHAKKI